MPLDWQKLSGEVNVEDIMTRRADLLCLRSEKQRKEVLRKAKDGHYDIVPVEKDGEIKEVLHVDDEKRAPIDRSWLVSGDTIIPDLVEIFSSPGRPALLVLKGQDIVGLVTPADLNRIPARVFFYHLVAEFEWRLTDLVRNHPEADSKDAILAAFSSGRKKKILDRLSDRRKHNMDVGLLEVLYLWELIEFFSQRDDLCGYVGYDSADSFYADFESIGHRLRNPTMHSVGPLLRNTDDLKRIREYVQRIREVLENLWVI